MRVTGARRSVAAAGARVALWCAPFALLFLAGCPKKPPPRRGVGVAAGRVFHGVASWYGDRHHGRTTASGEPFDMNEMTAAHRRWRFGTLVEVTRLSNGKSVVVRINDRGPYKRGLIIDLSKEAARRLGMLRAGRARVRLRVVGRADEDER